MMCKPRYLVALIAATALGACMQVTPEASRADNAALYFHNDPVVDGSVEKQVDALQQMADEIVTQSAIRGGVIGAAVGCGLAVVASSNIGKCAASAAVGAASGAVAGRAAGQRSVKKRMQLVKEPELSRSLRNASSQFDSLRDDLPGLLAAQEERLNDLTLQLANGQISKGEHDRALAQVNSERADLAEALSLSEADMRRAARNLQTAAKRGQSGLDWHIKTANQLADDVASQRSSISLL